MRRGPWLSNEKDRLQLLRSTGHSFEAIGDELGRSVEACRVKFMQLEAEQARREANALMRKCDRVDHNGHVASRHEIANRNAKKRPCISCGAIILSSGPGHRMCRDCRARAANYDLGHYRLVR